MKHRTFWTGIAAMLVALVLALGPQVEAQETTTTATNNALVGAATNILTTDLTPSKRTQQYDVCVGCVTTNSVFNVIMTDTATGLVVRTLSLNSGTALTAGSLYAFSIPAASAFSYNFQVATLTTPVLVVKEVLNAR